MKTTGEEIFQAQARLMLSDMGMRHLDPAHGAAVDIVRWCLIGRRRPTHHRQVFLEQESPALLAYLEKLTASGDAGGWRTLEERIRLRAEVLRETRLQPCARPWYAAIWHTLPELATMGQTILDRQAEKDSPALEVAPTVAETNRGGSGGDGDKGSSGKAGSAGTTAKPRPTSRLALPVVVVVLTDAEKKVLDPDDARTDDEKDVTPEGTDVPDGPSGPKGPGGRK
jgi:hypothetical protein